MKTYICDPKKCKDCRKTACQTLCFRTTKKEQRARGITWIRQAIKTWKGEAR